MNSMHRFSALILAGTILFSTGCARHIVNNPVEAYDSLGTLEEHVSTRSPVLTLLTFGMIRHHSYKCLSKRLNRKLEWTARHKFGADAVNNVHYWPDVDSDASIAVMYGRGEMIRYKKFGQAVEAAPSAG